MNFQDLAVIETSAGYLDSAIKHGAKRAMIAKQRVHKHGVERLRAIERDRLSAIADSLNKSLSNISEKFPNLDGLPEFYAELVRDTLDHEKLKKSLAATSWAAGACQKLTREFSRTYGTCATEQELLLKKRQAIGRVSSMIRQIDKELAYLKKAREVMRTFPAIKTECFTVCIAGFPNVGKSTLLSKVTPATPEISNYAFTTKTLNVGYMLYRHNKIQFIDTPGTLNRPERMNAVEKQAYLALKYVANLVIYVYDPTETYPFSDQEALELIVREYGQDVLIYLSKTDVARKENVAIILKNHPDAYTDVELLKKKITEIFEKEYLR